MATAADGDEALLRAAETAPKLIVLDIILPKRSGYEVLRKLRATPAFKQTPIVMLSSKNQESDKYYGKALGANAYLTKPFDDNDLLRTIGQLIAAPTVT